MNKNDEVNMCISTGNYVYPVYLYKRTLVAIELENTDHEFTDSENLILDVRVFRYGGWETCYWIEIPTFGML